MIADDIDRIAEVLVQKGSAPSGRPGWGSLRSWRPQWTTGDAAIRALLNEAW